MGDGATFPLILDVITSLPGFSVSSLTFDGAENIHCGDAGPLQTGKAGEFPITVSCWGKTSAASNQGMVGKRPNTGIADGFSFYLITTGAVRVYIAESFAANKQVTTTATGFNDGVWHHSAFTWDGVNAASITVYVDGAVEATGTDRDDVITNYGSTRTDVTIGSARYTNEKWTGNLDAVAIYDKELTGVEITTIYNSGGPVDHQSVGRRTRSHS